MSGSMSKAELRLQLRLEELEDIKRVASTAEGRRVLGRLFHLTSLFVVIPPTDPLVMSFNEGQRNVGLVFMNDLLEVAPEKYITMQKAAKEKQGRLKQLLDAAEQDEEANFWEEKED
jgi:hypothetical protein